MKIMEILLELIVDQDREPVFPNRQSLGQMKSKLKGAETGHSLLKRKSEALTKYVLVRLSFESTGVLTNP